MDFVIYIVTQVLKLHSPAALAIFRAWKTSPVPIYHEMHKRSYDFLYISKLSLWFALSPLSARSSNTQIGVVYELY